MFRFHLGSFLLGCLVGTAGITFLINIFTWVLQLAQK